MNEILRLIKDEVCMGTYGLVELELRKLVEENGSSHNTGSPKCLCETCSRLLSNGGTCQPNTNSFVTACGGFTEPLRAGA
jgi:hypothetical protein